MKKFLGGLAAFILIVSLFVSPVLAAKKAINVVAIGDSLTYGVGSSKKHKGGYVPLIKDKIKNKTHRTVHTKNYGIGGETSAQILKIIKNKKNIRASVRKANVIVLTAGGNDVMHALQKYGVKLTQKDLTSYQNKYADNVKSMIKSIRHLNKKAPIYIYGIYDPYLIYFEDEEGMKKALSDWNNCTQDITNKYSRTHYVDITALERPKKVDYNRKTKETTNPLVYDKDRFHPNEKGYKLMTNKLWAVMEETRSEWSR